MGAAGGSDTPDLRDLEIDFTGSLHLNYPYYDLWNIPLIAKDSDPDPTPKAKDILDFEDGELL